MTTLSFGLAGRRFEMSAEDVRVRLAQHNPQTIRRYAVDIDGTAWPVKQVVAVATGLSPRQFQSRQGRRVLVKLGFDIRVVEAAGEMPKSGSVQVPLAEAAANVMDRLNDKSRAMTLAEIEATRGTGLRSPGLYSWWVDEAGAGDLSEGLGCAVSPGLIYVGLAGATRKDSRPSASTLWDRITRNHAGRRSRSSTLRRSLGAILADQGEWSAIDETRLTQWMERHLRVAPVPVPDAALVDALETHVLKEMDPPLNLCNVPRTPLRGRLRVLRKRYS